MNAPKRRWFAYSLRTLFVVVTVFGVWLGYELNWIRQRHEFLVAQESLSNSIGITGKSVARDATAPGMLWLLGEKGVSAMGVIIAIERLADFDDAFDWDSHETMREAKRLFPECRYLGFSVVERSNPARALPANQLTDRSNAP